MALDPQLLEILACPDTHHAPLDYDAGAQTLTCTECTRVFEVRDGVPVLLRQGRFLVASFHPELTGDTRVHERFLDLIREEANVRA